MSTSTFNRIIWAIDAYANDELDKKTVSLIRTMALGQQVSIEPVYVHPPDRAFLPIQTLAPLPTDMRSAEEKRVFHRIEKAGLPLVTTVTFLNQEYFSASAAVKQVIEHAHKIQADLIAVSGTFAETMALHSDIPLLIINKQANIIARFSQIFFPVDSSLAVAATFDRVIELANTFSAPLTLFHHIEYAPYLTYYYPILNTPTGPSVNVNAMKKHLGFWAARAARRGVRADVVVDETPSDTATAILKCAENFPDALIAMVSQSGPLRSALLGSTTKKVIRRAPCAVWAIHPRLDRERRKRAA